MGIVVSPEDDTPQFRRWAAEQRDRREDRFWFCTVIGVVAIVIMLSLVV